MQLVSESDPDDLGPWSWESARVTRLLECASWPMWKKLAWIQSAGELADRLAMGRKKMDAHQWQNNRPTSNDK